MRIVTAVGVTIALAVQNLSPDEGAGQRRARPMRSSCPFRLIAQSA
jgi:hypothetical protein